MRHADRTRSHTRSLLSNPFMHWPGGIFSLAADPLGFLQLLKSFLCAVLCRQALMPVVPLSLPLGMFIKFLQSSLFSSPSPLPIVLASPLLNLSSVLIPDVPLSFCVRSTVQNEGLYIIFILSSALSSTHLLPKRQLNIY